MRFLPPITLKVRENKPNKKRDTLMDKYGNVPPWVKEAEFKLDRYNHLMELMRTCLAGCTLILQIVILLKLFKII